MPSRFFILSILLVALFFGFFLYKNKTRVPSSSQTAIVALPQEEELPKSTTLYFVGDIMLDRGVKRSVEKNFAGSYEALFSNASFLKDGDILFGNLEGPVSDQGRNVGSKYSFRFEPRVVPALKNAGFDIVSIANNHMGDWTVTAFEDTLTHLQEYGILFTGGGRTRTDAERPAIIEKNGVRFGFLGFSDVGPEWIVASDTTAGILSAKNPRYAEIINTAKKDVDVLIVSVHWGDEYKPHNDRQRTLAHTAIDNGTTLVIGHHPHVSQDTEFYKDGFIAYSLGNFVFDQYFSEETMQGSVVRATFKDSQLEKTEVGTSYLNKKFQIESIEFPNSEVVSNTNQN